jgi:hypothetical protein
MWKATKPWKIIRYVTIRVKKDKYKEIKNKEERINHTTEEIHEGDKEEGIVEEARVRER